MSCLIPCISAFFHDAGLSGQGLTGTGRTILFQLAEITEVTLDEPQDVRFPVEGLVIDHLVRQLSRGTVTLECALADIEHTAQVVIVQKTLPVRQDGKRLLHVPRAQLLNTFQPFREPLHPSVEIFLIQKHGLLLWSVFAPHGTLLQHTADFREGIIQLPVDGRIGDHVIRAEALKGTPADAQVTADLLAVHPFVVYILLIPSTPLFRERGDCSLYFLYTPDKLVIGSRTDHYDFHTPLFFSLLQRSGLYGQLKTRSVRLFFDNLQ